MAQLAITGDWGSGYCASLEITNVSENSTESWVVSLGLGDSVIYTSWNATFSGATGVVGLTALQNGSLDPGETVGNIGFCANRTTSGVLPVVFGGAAL
jgi:cellulase/cellobiase CelA1